METFDTISSSIADARHHPVRKLVACKLLATYRMIPTFFILLLLSFFCDTVFLYSSTCVAAGYGAIVLYRRTGIPYGTTIPTAAVSYVVAPVCDHRTPSSEPEQLPLGETYLNITRSICLAGSLFQYLYTKYYVLL